jgi:hypothetical protein
VGRDLVLLTCTPYSVVTSGGNSVLAVTEATDARLYLDKVGKV